MIDWFCETVECPFAHCHDSGLQRNLSNEQDERYWLEVGNQVDPGPIGKSMLADHTIDRSVELLGCLQRFGNENRVALFLQTHLDGFANDCFVCNEK